MDDAVKQKSTVFRDIGRWARDLLFAVVAALVLVVFFYQPVRVEGTSMLPGLVDQERIFVNKFVYRFEGIGRGDIVVFRYPLDPSRSYIKRVIGVPGDRVEIRRGQLWLNDRPVEEEYVPDDYVDPRNFGPVIVEEGAYFVMGDHRNQSNDSRAWGVVPGELVYGKAVFRYWPVDRMGVLE
jgi:signal peptidase I